MGKPYPDTIGNVPRLALSTGWPPSIGIGARFPSDWVAAFRRNHWPPCPGIRTTTLGHVWKRVAHSMAQNAVY